MKKKITILLLLSFCVAMFLVSCSKGDDYGYLNTDRRNCGNVSLVSKRYTVNWVYITTVYVHYGQKCGNDYDSYKTLKPDTLISSCSIDGRDSAFRKEIRSWKTD